MTTPASLLCRVLFSGFAALYPLGMAHSAPIPPTDNTDAPYMGVYEWGFATKSNLDRIGVAADWWSRRQLWGQEFAPTDSWDSLQCPDWLLAPAAGWVRQDPSRYYILSIGMLPGPWNGSGPATGLGAGVPVSLAVGATGAYNGYFQTLAQNLVRNGLADNTIIRLGWEFNGTWYAWRADTGAKALDYAKYWQQIVTAMRAVPGAANLKFCWNGAIGWTSYPLADAYPGDAYVDIVGVDCYDQSWVANSYPYPANATAVQLQTSRQNAWNDIVSDGSTHGLTWWNNFAASHDKVLAIPEWGLCNRTDSHGGLDNPFFIQKMYDFIQDPANGVFFHVYFDVQAGDGHHQVTPQNGSVTEFPTAAALVRKLFGYFPYQDADIGTVGAAGSSVVTTPQQMSISGSGAGCLVGGTSDQVHYLSRPLSGDGEIKVRLASAAPGIHAQSGLMIRESNASGAKYAAIALTNGVCWFQTRSATGAASVRENTYSLSSPQWLSLRRKGNRISAFYSADGTSWTFAGTHEIAMAADVLIGMAVSSGTAGTLGSASFEQLDRPVTVTLDNSDTTRVTLTGSWGSSSSSYGFIGSDYIQDGNTAKGSKSVLFTPTLPSAGTYTVYINWAAGTNRAPSVPVTITHANGTSTVSINQQADGTWVSLGTYQFASGSAGSVRLSNAGTTGYVVADAVRFVATPPRVEVSDNADSSHATLIGSWTATTSLPGFVDTNYLHDDNISKGSKSVTYTPAITQPGQYRIYMSWLANSNRASNIPVVINHSAGIQSLTVNEKVGGLWNLLGTFSITPGSSVQISNAGTNGYVAIDAIRWEAVAETP